MKNKLKDALNEHTYFGSRKIETIINEIYEQVKHGIYIDDAIRNILSDEKYINKRNIFNIIQDMENSKLSEVDLNGRKIKDGKSDYSFRYEEPNEKLKSYLQKPIMVDVFDLIDFTVIGKHSTPVRKKVENKQKQADDLLTSISDLFPTKSDETPQYICIKTIKHPETNKKLFKKGYVYGTEIDKIGVNCVRPGDYLSYIDDNFFVELNSPLPDLDCVVCICNFDIEICSFVIEHKKGDVYYTDHVPYSYNNKSFLKVKRHKQK